MSNDRIHEGGCLCGAVRYRASAEPVHVLHCHCAMCRRQAGAVALTWATFPVASVAWTKGAPKIHCSSENGRRGFCERCGTALTFAYLSEPDFLTLTVGSLDHPENAAPKSQCWMHKKISWLRMDEHLPGHDEVWTQDNAER